MSEAVTTKLGQLKPGLGLTWSDVGWIAKDLVFPIQYPPPLERRVAARLTYVVGDGEETLLQLLANELGVGVPELCYALGRIEGLVAHITCERVYRKRKMMRSWVNRLHVWLWKRGFLPDPWWYLFQSSEKFD